MKPYGDALTSYAASPVASAVGLVADAGFVALACYLWKKKHPVWASLLGLAALGGVGFNVYSLSQSAAEKASVRAEET